MINEFEKSDNNIKIPLETYLILVEKGNDGIVIIQDGILKFANDILLKLAGFSYKEAIGKSFIEFVSEPYKQVLLENYQKRISGSEGPQKYEIEICLKDNGVLPVEVNASRIDYNGRPADMAIIRDITEHKKQIASLKQSTLETLEAISRIVETNDPYTAGHSNRVAELATELASAMNISENKIELLRIAAFLHDGGKVGIPGSVLNKPTKLTHAEKIMLEAHPVMGSKTVENVTAFKEVIPIILHHHERWDGKGYPSGLKGEAIPLLARILAIADSYEAMTSERPYRMNPLSDEKTIEVLKKGAGLQWDPEIVDIFVKLKNY